MSTSSIRPQNQSHLVISLDGTVINTLREFSENSPIELPTSTVTGSIIVMYRKDSQSGFFLTGYSIIKPRSLEKGTPIKVISSGANLNPEEFSGIYLGENEHGLGIVLNETGAVVYDKNISRIVYRKSGLMLKPLIQANYLSLSFNLSGLRWQPHYNIFMEKTGMGYRILNIAMVGKIINNLSKEEFAEWIMNSPLELLVSKTNQTNQSEANRIESTNQYMAAAQSVRSTSFEPQIEDPIESTPAFKQAYPINYQLQEHSDIYWLPIKHLAPELLGSLIIVQVNNSGENCQTTLAYEWKTNQDIPAGTWTALQHSVGSMDGIPINSIVNTGLMKSAAAGSPIQIDIGSISSITVKAKLTDTTEEKSIQTSKNQINPQPIHRLEMRFELNNQSQSDQIIQFNYRLPYGANIIKVDKEVDFTNLGQLRFSVRFPTGLQNFHIIWWYTDN